MKRIFWFWSLINTKSLQFTVPNAQVIGPGIIKEFKRSFNLHDPIGFRTWEFQGIPMCALDVMKTNKQADSVNGVIFEMDNDYFEKLLQRENEYELVKTKAFDFFNWSSLWEVFVFSSNKNNATYDVTNEANNYYLYLCLMGAKDFWNDFYDFFVSSTYIRESQLWEITELEEILWGNKKYNLSYVA